MAERLSPSTYQEFIHSLCADYQIHNSLIDEARTNSNIKRGLRNDDGTGVMVGCTKVGNVLGYSIVDGDRVPMVREVQCGSALLHCTSAELYRGYDSQKSQP